MASADDINSTLQGISRNIANWVTAFNGRLIAGSVTLGNATVTVVAQPGVTGDSVIFTMATNAAAALTQRTNGLYVSALTAGSGFSLATQSGSASGSETFDYILFNPS
jgi:hypothetical protein